MTEILFGEKFNSPVVLALGFFDSIHNGHRIILNKVKKLSEQYNCLSAAMTFNNNPFKAKHKETKLVYTYDERLIIMNNIGINVVLNTEFNDNFKNISAKDFLDTLINNIQIKHIICGYDFKFGKDALGDKILLKEFCAKNGIGLDIIAKTIFDKRRISSTVIRNHLLKGDIIKANELLGDNYFIKGKVIHGNKIGTKLLFPTINIKTDEEKLKIAEGVYSTKTEIDGIKYLSITNCGKKPTFNNNEYFVETYIFDFDENIYDKDVIIFFLERLRDIIKFENPQDLKMQINKDIEHIKNLTVN